MNPEDLKPIEFRQLCALLRSTLQREPTMDDAEWKAQAMDTLAKWGFQSPKPEQMGRAMSAVEQAMKQTVGPRPIRTVPIPTVAIPAPVDVLKEPRMNNPPGWEIVVRLMSTLQLGSRGSAPLPPQPAGPRETLPVDEVVALNEFWQASWRVGANRLELLKAFAEIAIVRGPEWDYGHVRDTAEAEHHRLSAAEGCFVCRGEHSHWHHVIQIQFGGSNYIRNFVPLCSGCHSAIHPWLPHAPQTGRSRGWTHIGGIGADTLAELRKRVKSA